MTTNQNCWYVRLFKICELKFSTLGYDWFIEMWRAKCKWMLQTQKTTRIGMKPKTKQGKQIIINVNV